MFNCKIYGSTKLILLPILLLCGGCGYNDFGELKVPEYETITPNATIESVTAHYNGTPLNINDDIIVAGSITANDQSDNFYRTFVIQDATAAVEVRAGIFDLHNIFPIGRRVAIMARGLVLDSYNGVPQLALKSADGLPGYISNRYYPGSYFRPQEQYEDVRPKVVGLAEVTERQCGMLVRIDGLTLLPGEQEGKYTTWADGEDTGYRVFRDGMGAEITVMTSGFADFADWEVPRGRVALVGILMKGNSDKARGVWMLKLRDVNDVLE